MAVNSITLSPDTASIGIGGMAVIHATCKDIDDNIISPCPTLEWSSSDPSIATVEVIGTDSGLTTGMYPGTANITAHVSGIVSNISSVVVTGSVLSSISVEPTDASIKKGDRLYFNATCRDENDDIMICPTLTWSSSDPKIGDIDSHGSFVGLDKGITYVTASVGDMTSNSVSVTVSPIDFGIPLLVGIAIVTYFKIFRGQEHKLD